MSTGGRGLRTFRIQKADGSLHSVAIRLLSGQNGLRRKIITGIIENPQIIPTIQ
ncbi:MAG: hypothetical protein U5K79_22980 [Cyclobacteriaceae bacterium]|nr:hypothetical protein [Cyclobacteriaceae bacterium]